MATDYAQYVPLQLGVWESLDATVASGVASVTFGPPKPGQLWLVRRMITYASTGSPITTVYRSSADPKNIIDYTECPIDISDESSPIVLNEQSPLLFRWTSATNGAKQTAAVMYDLVSIFTDQVEKEALLPSGDAEAKGSRLTAAQHMKIIEALYPNQQTLPRYRKR